MKRAASAALISTVLIGSVLGIPAAPAMAGPSIGALAGAGERPGATRLSFVAGDSVRAQVDVGSGNLLVTVRGPSLPDVNRQVQLGAYYNSAASSASPVPRLGRGWGLDYTPDVRLVPNADDSVTYHASGGLTGVFDLAPGSSTSYVSPGGFKVSLVKDAAGYTMTEHNSQDVLRFDASGALVSITDRNGNATTLTQSGTGTFKDIAILTSAGSTAARSGQVSTAADGTTTLSQGASSVLRSVSFERPAAVATEFVDARGRATTFTYADSGLLTQIVAPGAVNTKFTYDAQRRIISITQVESSAGGPGNSVTRLAYPSATESLVADPNTDQSSSVASVPHTTYTLDATQRVTTAVDAAGRQRSATYTAMFDTATATAGTGAGASTTTNAYGANAGESLTSTTSPTGSAQSLSYATTSGPAQYNPTSLTDDAGNTSNYTYNGAGNQLTSTDAGSAQAKVTYNSDGTVATATSPGNGTNVTGYSYTFKQPTGMTPVTGSSLGARAYTYDLMRRLKTATNGRGITTTYTYNLNDQVTSVSYTGGTSVTYGYDTAGRNNSRVDASGTTSYTYDQLADSLTAKLRFIVDAQGRRTATYLRANAALTDWSGRNLITYDGSGRVTRVTADTGPDTGGNVVDISYCYAAGTTPAGGCTASTASDRDKLVWKQDNLTGKSTSYTYDTSGRLTSAAVSTGTSFNYAFNANSNRTSGTVDGATQTLTFNAANQITTSGYNYDGAGNLTADPASGSTAITYTPADQTQSVVKNGSTYSYTHAGTDSTELISQTSPDGAYTYTYGRTAPTGVPIVEQVERVNGSTTTNASVISDPVTGIPLMLKTTTGSQNMYIYDGTPGAPIAAINLNGTNTVGYDYDPYGVPTVTQDAGGNAIIQNPYTFGGAGVKDRTTGWVHYGARYYSTKTATWTQQDTLDAPLDPANGNRYAYAGNDPINNTDPTGTCTSQDVSEGLAAQVGLYAVAEGGLAAAGVSLSAGLPVTVGLGALIGLGAAASYAYCATD